MGVNENGRLIRAELMGGEQKCRPKVRLSCRPKAVSLRDELRLA